MGGIKAIETHYKGYRFRSRLEARWAVFFDAMKIIVWQYEPEGFDLGSEYYLPDFYLPHYRLWIEIKGESPSETEKQKCKKLCAATQQDVLLLFGQPFPDNQFGVHCGAEMWRFHALDEDAIQAFLSDPDEYGGVDKVSQWQKDGGSVGEDFSPPHPLPFLFSLKQMKQANISAMNAFRAARFEHGETPRF